MYVNLLLGLVALVVVWLYLKKLLVKEDVLRENPAELLEKEVARRRAREDTTGKTFDRLRDTGRERMRPVVEALVQMRSAMPAVAGGSQPELSWDDEGDSVTIHARSTADNRESASLTVSWKVPDLDLEKAAKFGEDLPGVYILRRSDSGQEERVPGLDACVRSITSFIVDFMA